VPSDWTRRETIREVPAEEEDMRKSSVQFDPTAPVTHIYPPRPEKFGPEDEFEEGDLSRSHNPLSPVPAPEFISAPPTPRYNIGKRGGIQKQFSFGKVGRKQLTEEETVGLVEAGRNEGAMSDRESGSHHSEEHSEHSEESDFETGRGPSTSGRGTHRPYDMF
jgi:hypothetical protein